MTVEFAFQGEPVATRDAATVLVLRESSSGPEVFFVKRSAGARFMGGAYVFPGGRLDDGDRDPSVPCDLSADEAAQRLRDDDPARALGLHVAALRECLEESGILLATAPVPSDVVAALRAALAPRDAPPIGPLLARHGVTLATRSLVPFARWVTPRVETRRFDARFFLARATERHEGATHDGSETVDSAWLSPSEALDRALRGEIVVAPPTWRTLDTIRDARTVAEVLSRAPSVITPVEPEVVVERDAPCVVFPAASLPDGRVLAARFRYEEGAWTPVG
jgi:8-oxo-dGTP pyrophosphatase MutT (NUDIX family)